MCAHLSIRICTTQLQKRAEEGIRSPETRVTVIWKSPDVGARTQIWVLHKNVQMLLAAEPSVMSPRCFFNNLLGASQSNKDENHN